MTGERSEPRGNVEEVATGRTGAVAAVADQEEAAASGVGRSVDATAGSDGLRVLVYNYRDPDHPDSGGAEVYTHEVLSRLVDRGHEATLFCPAHEECETRTEIDGIEVVREGNWASVYGRAPAHYRRVRGEYDVIVDEVNGPPFLTPLYAEEPVVALIHHVVRDEWLTEMPFPIGRLGYGLTDWWLKLYRSVPTITVSRSTKFELSELGFEDVTIARNGVDVEPVKGVPEKPDTPTFAFVGRMVEAKRPHHAIETVRHVREAHPDARLHMVGDGYMREQLAGSVGDHVTFHGYVSERRKRELMMRSHALLVPSTKEGWGLVVIEANAVGTPAVGYNVPGLRDSIRNGKTGLLAAERPFRLARQAVSLLDGDYDRYASAAIDHARQHDWSTTTDAFERRLLEVVR